MVGTIIMPTGAGKTRVGVMAHAIASSENTLVITSRIPLIKQWQNEFKEYGLSTKFVTFMCINSAYKASGHYKLVIIDEVHRALSPAFRAVFENITTNYMLCLTATLPSNKPDYVEILNRVSPVVYEKYLDEVVDMQEVVSDFFVYNLECSFAPKNKAMYKMFDSRFNSAAFKLSTMKRYHGYDSVFEMARDFSKMKDASRNEVYYAKEYWTGMTMRKQAVYSNPDKITLARKIIQSKPGVGKWILFTKSIAFAEKTHEAFPTSILYHSKMKDDEREAALKAFEDGKHNILVAVDALNEGLNVPEVDAAICLSGVSTELVNTQQLGRILRYKTGKRAIFINLYTTDTVEKRWVTDKTKRVATNTKWIKTVDEIKWV